VSESSFSQSFICCTSQVATTSIVKPLYVILSDEETEKILQSASDCAEGECSIDDVSELIAELKEQEKEMQSRLDKIMNMISHLQHINAKEERKTDEVRAFVRDLLRTFSSDKPLYFPTGFAGDVGDGPTTAYDALPPKKWVPADKKK
jgi:DNA mismatch repair ATPase MutL